MAKVNYKMNKLLSNIVHEKKYSHCRLCLVEIQTENQFLKFQDSISVDENDINFQSLQEIINTIFLEDKFTEEIPGIDAVCVPCVNKAVQCIKFIKMCQSSSETLGRMFDNILTALNDTEALEIDTKERDKRLYLSVCKTNYKCALIVKNEENKITQGMPKKQTDCMCHLCYIDFGSVMSLKAHNASYHFTATCLICYETFIDKSELSDHVRTNHQFKCSHCDVTKNIKKNLEEHMYRAHIYVTCKICEKTFKGSDNLDIHNREHHEKNDCPKCGKSYTVKRCYINHVKVCLGDKADPSLKPESIIKTFLCMKCKKSFTTEGALRVHMRCMHGHPMSHECSYCGMKFTALSSLRRHLVIHTGEKNFQCNICNNKFITKQALLFHKQRHNGEKPLSCSHCNEKFLNASERTEHIKHHINSDESISL